ncbi:MFS transporter [Catellatospora methionotrophica]|uniref:MFS transporter n=1 Tax=Catellatospora methionotrophica TaxID=121620 RepID=A0A8J3LNZ8_9ACTN|nr:MFS transporter [Catellatospora methionotrophica]GIG16245.1 MFS transporter [Catellatospora methionotrophica]
MSGLAVVTAARRYRALIASPGVARVALPSLIGRLPYGMATLVFILAVQHGTGSYAVAGIATGAHSAITAFTSPWLGRLCDRGHAVAVLRVTGVLYALMLSGMVAALWTHQPVALIIGLAALAGAVNPPVGAVTRVVLPGLAPAHVQTAYAFDAITVELTYVLGPVLIALVTAVSNPYVAVIVTALLATVGSLGLAAAPGLTARYREVRTAALARAATAGVTTSAALERALKANRLMRLSMVVVLVVGALEAAAYGVMEVAIPKYAADLGAPQAAGAVVAAWSAGSILGGVWFSGMNPKLSQAKLFALLLCLNTVGFAAMLLAFGLPSLALILFLGGMVISPTTAVECSLVTRIAPAGRSTEAFTWVGTGIYVGFAAGSSLSGLVINQGTSLSTVILIATAMVATGALLALAASRRITTDAATNPVPTTLPTPAPAH